MDKTESEFKVLMRTKTTEARMLNLLEKVYEMCKEPEKKLNILSKEFVYDYTLSSNYSVTFFKKHGLLKTVDKNKVQWNGELPSIKLAEKLISINTKINFD